MQRPIAALLALLLTATAYRDGEFPHLEVQPCEATLNQVWQVRSP